MQFLHNAFSTYINKNSAPDRVRCKSDIRSYAFAGAAGSVLSGVGRFMPTLSSRGVTSVVTMTMRTTAGNMVPDISPAMLPF